MKTKEFKFTINGMPALLYVEYSHEDPNMIDMIRLNFDVYVACGEKQVRECLKNGLYEQIIAEINKQEPNS